MPAAASRAKSTYNSKSAPAAKKSSASSGKAAGPKLRIRYARVMKPQRVYGLIVEVPGSKKKKTDDDAARGGIVVVRPIIPGAQVVPAEHRLEVAPGNQVSFHVTPLAKGKLPRARLEVHAAGQAPETVPLTMKARTNRLALVLLVLAYLVPVFMNSLTKGSLKPPAGNLDGHFKDPMMKGLPPVPLFNEKADFLPEGWEKFTIAGSIGDGLVVGYTTLSELMEKRPWLPNVVGFGFVLLAFLAWFFGPTKRKTLNHTLKLKVAPAGDAEASAEEEEEVLETV
jgi:hypothetical protein